MPVTAIWDGSVWQPIQGLQGPEGPAGTDGTDGADGATGAQGPQGIPGPSSVSSDAGNEAVLGSDQLIYVPEAAGGWEIATIFNAQNGNISSVGPGSTIGIQSIAIPPTVGDEYMIQYTNSVGLRDTAGTATATLKVSVSFDGGATTVESEIQIQTDSSLGRSIASLAVVGQGIATGGNLQIKADITSNTGASLSNPSRGFGTTTIWVRTP